MFGNSFPQLYILCINSKFATLRPSKFECIIIYLGKPLVQTQNLFHVEYSEECGIANRRIFHAHLLVEHEYGVNIETQARSIFQHTYMSLIHANGICGNGTELKENILFV